MIYVVEDDKSIRELVAYALGSAGYETEGFTSGAEFFAALDAARARLVLLDIMLPGEDGLAILRRLRETPETAEITKPAESTPMIRIITVLVSSEAPETITTPSPICSTAIPRAAAVPNSVAMIAKMSTSWPAQPSVSFLPNSRSKIEDISRVRPRRYAE